MDRAETKIGLQVVEAGAAAGCADSFSFRACARVMLAAIMQLPHPGGAIEFKEGPGPVSLDDALWWARGGAGAALRQGTCDWWSMRAESLGWSHLSRGAGWGGLGK